LIEIELAVWMSGIIIAFPSDIAGGMMTSPQGRPRATLLPGIVRFGASLAALASVLAGKALIACRLRRPPEGWRRTLGILLRSEPTRFALSAFMLRIPGPVGDRRLVQAREDHIARELRAYLESQPDAHFELDWDDVITSRRPRDAVDVALMRFSSTGELVDLIPYLADTNAPADAPRSHVHQAVVAGYNRTRHLPETERPAALVSAAQAACAWPADRRVETEMKKYARRLLAACCLSFEGVDLSDPTQRFTPPEFTTRRSLGFGFLSIVMRLSPDGRAADLWVSAHHVGLDGVPLQELVTGLERAWGTHEPVSFPAADVDRPFMAARRCSVPGERDVHEAITFVDFSPVLALRAALNERYASAIGAPVTFGTVLAWLLNREPEFAGVRIASTVDVAASGGYERDVDVVPLRPADFVTGTDPWGGFVDFAKEFNRLVALSRARTSPLRRGLQTAGLLPPRVHAYVVRSNPAALDDTFGSLCVTIIRDAKVFMAPMTDLGLGHGFFAIGNLNLPSADGRAVAAVSIKGAAGTIAGHAPVLQRLVARSAALSVLLSPETTPSPVGR
jgi:hypothetical protein